MAQQTQPLDFYNDEDVDLEFLHSKPTSFLIIGKPFSGKSSLAKKLAKDWDCPFINPDDLVDEAIGTKSDIGELCLEFLKQGLKIERDLIFSLVKERMSRPDLLNSGYVLDGFPTLSDRGMQIPDQLVLMDSWNLKPNVLIHIKVSDADVIKRKKGSKVNPLTGTVHVREETEENGAPTSEPAETEIHEIASQEDIDLPPFDSSEFEKLNPFLVENMVSVSNQVMRQFIKDLDRYNRKFPLLQNYIANRPKIINLEVDGNLPPKSLFNGLMSTLNLMPVPRPVLPILLSESSEFSVQEDASIDEMIYVLNKVNMVAPLFRWKLSRWGQCCPVDLKSGNMVLGMLANAVVYRDKIYFIANYANLEKFLQNPRPYLIPPMPLHPCKFIIFGHIKTGKTSLAWKLSTKFKGRVIDLDRVMQVYTREVREQYLDETWRENLNEIIAEIQTREILNYAVEVEEARAKRIHELALGIATKFQEEKEREATGKARTRAKSRYSRDYSATSQSTGKSADESSESKTTDETSESTTTTTFEEKYLQSLELESVQRHADAEEIPMEIPLVDEDHPEVVAIINTIMEVVEAEELPIENEAYVDQLIKEIEVQRLIMSNYGQNEIRDGGWVIDNFPADEKLFETAISMGVVPVCVIILKDPTEDYKIVSKRFVKTKFRRRTITEGLSHPSPPLEVHEPSEETSSESAPDFDRLMEEELNKVPTGGGGGGGGGGGEESVTSSQASTIKLDDDQIEAKPQLTESEIALVKLKGTLSQMDTFFDNLSNYLPADGTVTIIPVQITNEKNLMYTGDSFGTTPEEYATAQMSRFNSSQQFHTMSDIQSQATRSELIAVHDIAATVPRIHKSPDDIALEVVTVLEAEFYYKGKVVNDLDREQHDTDAQQNVDVLLVPKPGETLSSALLQQGDTSYFCPVALKEAQVLYPGKLELELKFKDKTYWFSSETAMEAFIKRPSDYTADKKTLKLPPPRFCVVGPFGSQRTEYARLLATSLNIFHINFRERLQEQLLPKIGRKLGFPYQIDQEQMDEEDEMLRFESKLGSIRTSLDLESKDSQVSVTWSDVENADEKSKKSKRSVLEESTEESQEAFDERSFFTEFFTDEERNYKDYLQNGTPLYESSLERLLSPLWYQEPYCSTGFILDGFPTNTEETEFLLTHSLMPDAVIFLIVRDVDIVQKLQDICMKLWYERKEAKRIRKEEEMQLAIELRENGIAKRRQQLEEEIAKRKAASEKTESEEQEETESEIDDQATEINIDEIIAEEFPEIEEVVEEEEETPRAAEARYNSRLLGMLQLYEETNTSIKDMFQEAMVHCSYVDSRKEVDKGAKELRVELSPFIERRDNLFEKTFPVKISLAEKLIRSGYKTRSKFGHWCPTKLYEGITFPNLYSNGREPLGVIHRHHIYYLSSESAREKFMLEPMKYVCQPLPPPIAPINVAFIGTPCSGKTTLIQRFVKEYNLIKIGAKQILTYLLSNLSNTALSDYMKEYLQKGDDVPNEIIAAALDEVLMHPVCQQQGVILDGIPNSLELAECLTERNIIPFCIFELKIPFEEVLKRVHRMELKQSKPTLKTPRDVLKDQYQSCIYELDQMEEYYDQKHHNYIRLDAQRSQWWLWTESSAKFLQSANSVQNYIVSTQRGEAAELYNMNLTPDEFKAGLGIFRCYCPVSLAIDGELIDCSHIKNNQFAAEYHGKYYAMCSKQHLNMFLSNPDVFLPPRAIRLPPKATDAPEKLSLEKCLKYSKSQVEFGGYCTVTYLQGFKTYEALVKGSVNFGVTYMSKVYYFSSEEKRKVFMKKPDHFAFLKLPTKIPSDLPPLNIMNLPTLGYLEQNVAEAVFKALTAVSIKKPKYPFLDVSRSAALFLAYHLKAHNPKNSSYTQKKYLGKLKEFDQHCQMLQYVVKNMTLLPSKPATRPLDFDIQLQNLFKLRPTPEWLYKKPQMPKPGGFFNPL